MHWCGSDIGLLKKLLVFVNFMKFRRLCVYYYKPGKDWIRGMMRHFSSWNCLLLQCLCHSRHHVSNWCWKPCFFTSTCSTTTLFFPIICFGEKVTDVLSAVTFTPRLCQMHLFFIIRRYKKWSVFAFKAQFHCPNSLLLNRAVTED